jgi:hypothetical protein
LAVLEKQGYVVSTTSRLEDFGPELEAMGKMSVSQHLSALMHDFTEQSAFCIALRFEGELVAVMGLRYDDLGRGSITDYWQSAYSRLYPRKSGTAVVAQVGEALHSIHGRVVYMGDLFFKEQFRGHGPSLTGFVHLAHALAWIKWKPDWTYAFHTRKDVLRGHTDKYGFNNRYPGVLAWLDPDGWRSETEFLATISRAEFEQKADFYARHPDLLLEG